MPGLPVAQTTVSKHWREKYHIPWTCLPQAHLEVFQLCLWPLTAPGYLGGGLPCLSLLLLYFYLHVAVHYLVFTCIIFLKQFPLSVLSGYLCVTGLFPKEKHWLIDWLIDWLTDWLITAAIKQINTVKPVRLVDSAFWQDGQCQWLSEEQLTNHSVAAAVPTFTRRAAIQAESLQYHRIPIQKKTFVDNIMYAGEITSWRLARVAGYVVRQFTCPKAVTHPTSFWFLSISIAVHSFDECQLIVWWMPDNKFASYCIAVWDKWVNSD